MAGPFFLDVVKLEATPHSLKYLAAGTAAVRSRTQAQMVADAAPGPLQQALATPGPWLDPTNAWINLPRGAQVSLYVTPISKTPAGPPTSDPVAGEFINDGSFVPVNALAIMANTSDARALVEIRFNHSIDR
jgi:hypothetical protein